MKLQAVKDLVTSKAGRQVLRLQKHSPRLLFVAGVVGVGATVFLACKATLKADEVIKKHQIDLEMAKDLAQQNRDDYTETDLKKDQVVIYSKIVRDFVKLYGPSLLTGVAAIACLTGAHVVLNRRNVGLTAAYAALERGYNEYRKRVIEKLGTDQDDEFRYGVRYKEFVEETEEGPVVKTEKVFDPNGVSQYARFFDELCSDFNRNPEYNLLFLRSQQNYMNDLLHSRGHVFLNEVYDSLDIPRTKAGSVVGWILSDHSDNFIDFGIFTRPGNERVRSFVRGDEGAILLDFNVDGVIYDKI